MTQPRAKKARVTPSVCITDALCPDALFHIFSLFQDYRDLYNCRVVCRAFCKAASHHVLWQRHAQRMMQCMRAWKPRFLQYVHIPTFKQCPMRVFAQYTLHTQGMPTQDNARALGRFISDQNRGWFVRWLLYTIVQMPATLDNSTFEYMRDDRTLLYFDRQYRDHKRSRTRYRKTYAMFVLRTCIEPHGFQKVLFYVTPSGLPRWIDKRRSTGWDPARSGANFVMHAQNRIHALYTASG